MIVQTLLCALAFALFPCPDLHAAGQAPPRDWGRFTSREGGFSVLMPGTPTRSSGAVDVAAGPPADFVRYNAYDAEVDYAVQYTDQFGDLDPTVEDLAAAYRMGKAEDPGSRLLGEWPVRVRGHEGWEFEFKVRDGIGRMRIFFVKGRLFTLTAGADHGFGSTGEFRERCRLFFESFAPLER